MASTNEYQLALDPFHEPDLFDEVSATEPAVDEGRGSPGEAVWVQDALEMDLPAPPERKVNQAELSRRSVGTMVELALERRYASSIGDLLDQVASLRQYKPFNGLMTVLQCPKAKHLLTLEEWRTRWGRRVKPGENPIVLLVPHGPVKFVFDVSQTEDPDGSQVLPPHLANPFEMKDVVGAGVAYARLLERAKEVGVRVSSTRSGYPSAGCIERVNAGILQIVAGKRLGEPARQVPVRYEVLVNQALSATEQLATLAHELGHLFCGHVGGLKADRWQPRRPDQPVREFEAESVAILVFERIAPQATLPPYLDQYFQPGQSVPEVAWDVVVRAASWVIDMCQEDGSGRS